MCIRDRLNIAARMKDMGQTEILEMNFLRLIKRCARDDRIRNETVQEEKVYLGAKHW